MAISDPDIIPHSDLVKRGVGAAGFICAKNRITQFCSKPIAAVSITKTWRIVVVAVGECHAFRISAAQGIQNLVGLFFRDRRGRGVAGW